MKITVTFYSNRIEREILTGQKYHINDFGLHIVGKENEPLRSYAPGYWKSIKVEKGSHEN